MVECHVSSGVFTLEFMAGSKSLNGRRGKQALALLHQLNSLFVQWHIPYVLEAGTLLGIVRENRLLPWDNDIDFTITEDSLPRLPLLIEGIKEAGLWVKIKRYHEAIGPINAGSVRIIKVGIRLFPGHKPTPLADIFVKYRHQDRYYWSIGDPNPVLKSTPSHFYDERTHLTFNGTPFLSPLHYRDYLAYHYGPNWETPKTTWDFRYDDHCSKYPPQKPLYFIANSVYQFAYALPVYRKTGGVFVVNSYKKWFHFKRYLKNQRVGKPSGWCNTPNVVIIPPKRRHLLEGVQFFVANSIQPHNVNPRAVTLFHEHGTSDKWYENGDPVAVKKLMAYDHLVLSGPKNRERLKDIQCFPEEKKCVNAGCLRFDDFLNHQYDREAEKKKLGITDRSRPVVLYAPTWRFGNGTLRQLWTPFVEELTNTFSLIIRPHYHDRKYGYMRYLMEKAKGTPHLYFSNPNDIIHQDTYAVFAASDVLISDMSSVLYEYLITRKPIIAVLNDFKNKHKMPTNMDIMQHVPHYNGYGPIAPVIHDVLEQKERIAAQMEQLLQHCFYQTNGGGVSTVVSLIQQLRATGT
jgi:hypothetical protein